MLHLSHHLDPDWKTGCWLSHRNKNAKVIGDHHKYHVESKHIWNHQAVSFALDLSENWNQFEECWLLLRTPTIPYHTHTQLSDHQKDVCCFITPIKNDPWNTFVNKTKLSDSTPPCTTPPFHEWFSHDLSIFVAQISIINIEFPMSDASITILLINYTPEYVKSPWTEITEIMWNLHSQWLNPSKSSKAPWNLNVSSFHPQAPAPPWCLTACQANEAPSSSRAQPSKALPGVRKFLRSNICADCADPLLVYKH